MHRDELTRKTLCSQKLRMLLSHHKLLQSKPIAVENDLHATLRNFGLKVGMIETVKFEARIRELSRTFPIVPIWPYCSSRCSLTAGQFASSSACCIAASGSSSRNNAAR
jgi:hypothetical protein